MDCVGIANNLMNILKKFSAGLLPLYCFFVLMIPSTAFAQDLNPLEPIIATSSNDFNYQFPKDEFYNALVIGQIREGKEEIGGYTREYQVLALRILDGPDKGKTIEVQQGQLTAMSSTMKVEKGERVIVTKTNIAGEIGYSIIDRYRLDTVFYLIAGFVFLILLFGRKKGIMSILGLVFSVVVLAGYLIPRLIAGDNPFVVTLVSLLVISFISLYLAHGFNKRTSLSLVSTLITLGISVVISMVAVSMTKLTGLGSEEAFFLQLGPLGRTNLQGLLLGGILIGTLGVLDDITTAQTASIEEISKANAELDMHELYTRGLSVGREHIASLVNTLFLAYAGSSLPLFLLFSINRDLQPLWLTLNSEQVVEEIIRTVVGSSALILAVPISTLLAAYVYGKRKAAPVGTAS